MNREISLHTIALYNGTEYELENLLNSLLYKIDQLEQELQRKDNIIKDAKEVLLTTNNIEKALNVLDKIKELENGNK